MAIIQTHAGMYDVPFRPQRRRKNSWTYVHRYYEHLICLCFRRNIEDHGRVDFVAFPEEAGEGLEMLLGLMKLNM